jgi:vitamin B12 transporter
MFLLIKENRSFFLFKTYILLFILFFSSFLFAQDEQDSIYITEEIKVVSFRNEKDILNSASNIHIINSERISTLNGKNAGEILSTVPGVFIKNYGNASSLQTISLNGLGAEHTTILFNGSKLNSLQNGQIDLSLIPKENIKRVEVLNNGYSSVYGSEAMGGIVNIITEDESTLLSKNLSLSLNTSYGSYNNKRISFCGNKRNKVINFDFLISNEKSDNDYSYYFDTGEKMETRKRQNAGYTINNYAITFNANVIKSLKLKLYSQYINSDKNVPDIETGNTSTLTKQIDKNWNTILDVNYKGKIISLDNETNFQNNLMNYITVPVLNSYYKNIVVSNLTRLNYRTSNFFSILGLEVLRGSLQSDQVEDSISRKQYSIFSSSTVNIERLILYPSLRYDYISDIKKNVWTYKFGFNYKLLANYDLHLRSNYGRNFRTPTFNELYWKDVGNKNILPEESNNFEFGAIASDTKPIFYVFEISYIYIDAKNRILWRPGADRIWRPVNILTSESKIFNTSLKLSFDLKRNLKISSELSYSHNSSIKKSANYTGDVTVDKQMIYIPKEQAKISLGLMYASFEVNLFYSYIGTRYSDSENLNSLSPASTLDGNIKYGFKISNLHVDLKFDINNLTNTDYQYISGYPLPLRNFLFSINLKYTR